MIIPEQAKNELMTINQFQKFYDSAHPKTRSAEVNIYFSKFSIFMMKLN